jgi:hypothetical protein
VPLTSKGRTDIFKDGWKGRRTSGPISRSVGCLWALAETGGKRLSRTVNFVSSNFGHENSGGQGINAIFADPTDLTFRLVPLSLWFANWSFAFRDWNVVGWMCATNRSRNQQVAIRKGKHVLSA